MQLYKNNKISIFFKLEKDDIYDAVATVDVFGSDFDFSSQVGLYSDDFDEMMESFNCFFEDEQSYKACHSGDDFDCGGFAMLFCPKGFENLMGSFVEKKQVVFFVKIPNGDYVSTANVIVELNEEEYSELYDYILNFMKENLE